MTIKSPLLYTGDKYKIVDKIYDKVSNENHTFVDLFCGGGSVAVNSRNKKIIMNDTNTQIINLHNFLQSHSAEVVIKRINEIKNKYLLKNTNEVSPEDKKENPKTFLAKINKKSFLNLRESYNRNKRTDYLLVLIMFSFNHQIRFNSKGEYNLPVGNLGIPLKYNEILMNYKKCIGSKEINIFNYDYKKIIKKYISKKNIIFYIDPPYLNTKAQYNVNWTEMNDVELINEIYKIDKSGNKFILSNMEHNKNIIEKLKMFNIKYIEHKHISFRKNKNVREIIIYN